MVPVRKNTQVTHTFVARGPWLSTNVEVADRSAASAHVDSQPQINILRSLASSYWACQDGNVDLDAQLQRPRLANKET